MPYNLKNRSFLKLLDFTKRDLTHLLNLARDLKRAKYAGNEVQRLQGKNISPVFDDPSHKVRDAAFCVAPSRRGFLLREDRWAYIQYVEDASGGAELFDMKEDPRQYTNLAAWPEYAGQVDRLKAKLALKLRQVRDNDLNLN